jgi:hypothetical protein
VTRREVGKALFTTRGLCELHSIIALDTIGF